MVSARFVAAGAAAAAILLASSLAVAQEYYVDPAGDDSLSGTSEAEAWQTLDNVDSLGFAASGYTVYLKAGGEWQTSGLRISNGTLARYGEGPAPVLVGTEGGFGVISVSGDAVVDGILVRGEGRTGISVNGDNNVVQNCEVDGSSGSFELGFGIMGEGNLITGNSVHDLSGQTGDSGDMNSSGGAEAYMVMASNNEISYNSAVNCWGVNQTLGGAEGGCLEIVNGEALSTIENVRFHHNYCERSVGLFEGCSGNFSGTDAIQENHGIIRDSVIAYNISVDAMWLYLLQPVNTDFYNLVFEHNTLIHTSANEDIPQGGASSFGLLVNDDQGYTADPLQPGMVIVRDNLFAVISGSSAMLTEVPDHYNNLFSPSAPMGYTLGTGDIEASDPGLTADYRLAAGSPAIDAGSSDAWQQWTDFDGNAVPLGTASDIGASEYCEGSDCEEPTATGGTTGSGGSAGADSGGTTATTGGDSSTTGGTTAATGGDSSTTGGTTAATGGDSPTTGGTTATGGDTGTQASGGNTAVGGATAAATGGAPAAGGAGSTCAAGLTQCDTVCVDLASDANNCGACGNACAAGQVCSAGVCTSTCAAGLTQCGQACVDLNTDILNCGACGVTCLAGQTCSAGQCVGDATGGAVTQPIPAAPTTATGAGPSPGAAGATGLASSETTSDPAGCACLAAGTGSDRRGAALATLLGLLALGRRRRRAG